MKLNALIKTLGFIALAATPAVAGTAPAPKNPIAPAPVNDDLGITASIGYDSRYVWRGLNFGPNWVRAGISGSHLLVGGSGEDGAGSTSLLWDVQFGSIAGSNIITNTRGNEQNNFTYQRLQVSAALAHDFGPATVSLGYRYYQNMGAFDTLGLMNPAQEAFLGLATALGPVNLASTANYDFVNFTWYFDLTASSTIKVTDSISIVPFATMGYGHKMSWQFARGRNAGLANTWVGPNSTGPNSVTGFTAVTTGVRFPIKVSSRATLTPYIAVNVPMGATANLASNVRYNGAPDTPYKSVLYGGVTLSISF